MPSHLAHFPWQQKDDASTNHKQESKCHLLIQMQQRHFFYINKLLKSKILSSYLWKLCCFIHHIYTQDTAIKKTLMNVKTTKVIHYFWQFIPPNLFGQWNYSKAIWHPRSKLHLSLRWQFIDYFWNGSKKSNPVQIFCQRY